MASQWHPTAAQRAWLDELREQRATARRKGEEEAQRLVEVGAKAPSGPEHAWLRGLVSGLRGQLAEERLVRVLNEMPGRPPWLVEARRAPEDMDALGVDLIVVTDRGEVPLQVKSCQAGVETWRRGYRELVDLVGVVVAPIEMPDAEAFAAGMAELERMREVALAPVD